MMNVIVTGANRGIGKAICEAALRRSDIPVVHIIACSRTGDDLKLGDISAAKKVSYQKLDISDNKSIEVLRERLLAANQKVDVLINNAGINLDNHYNLENAETTLEVNYRATIKMCQTFIPHMSKDGRIVNVSSIASSLRLYKEETREQFRSAATLDEVNQIAEGYLNSVKNGTEEKSGFGAGGRSYSVSKALLNAATRILARDNEGLVINSCCPGWVDTDMGNLIGKPTKTLEQGTTIPLRLAFHDLDGVSGRFWANSSVSSAEAGQPQRW